MSTYNNNNNHDAGDVDMTPLPHSTTTLPSAQEQHPKQIPTENDQTFQDLHMAPAAGSNNRGVTFYAPVDGWPLINMVDFKPPAQGTTCWICQGAASSPNDSSFFYPCNCGAVHRLCFHEWRKGWITPKNYFSCPTCMHNYTIERTEKDFDPASQEESEIRSAVRWRLAIFWFLLFFVLIGSVCVWASVAWAADRDSKDIPIGISYVLTSVVRGVPDANTTKLWREDFIDPDTPTWPYYGTFGILLTSILIILIFVINTIYETCCEEEEDQRREPYRNTETTKCSDQCHCSSTGNDCNCCIYCYLPHCPSSDSDDCCCHAGSPEYIDGCCDACWCHCDRFDGCRHFVNCDCGQIDCGCLAICGECGEGCGECAGSCCEQCGETASSATSGCDPTEAIPVMCVVAIVVAIAIVTSAVIIVAYFAGQRLERYHAWLSTMLYNRQLELNNKMVVIGKGESLRSTTDV